MNARDLVGAGVGSLERGDWVGAREAFTAACEVEVSADALLGLSRAQWWLGEVEAALELGARAFARLRRRRRDQEAAAVAIWLAREHRFRYRRAPVADGWLARARSLIADLTAPGALEGWLLLAGSEARPAGRDEIGVLDRAVALAVAHDDGDLEIVTRMRRGTCAVESGEVSRGLTDVHEAMTAATSGEGHDVQYVAEALCGLLEVAGVLGDPAVVEPWADQLGRHRSAYAFGPLLPFAVGPATDLISSFCAGCCGAVFLVTGRVDAAEAELQRAARLMAETGLRPRCVHPVAELVGLRLLQGRLAEAELLLAGFEDDPDCAVVAAAVDLARGRPQPAVIRLRAALDDLADREVRTVAVCAPLVEATLAAEDAETAEAATRRLAGVASTTGTPLHVAHRDQSAGLVALAAGSGDAPRLLRAAAHGFARVGAALPASRARLSLARSLVPVDRGLAVAEARAALQAFERMGAPTEADRAAAFLRGLGVRGRTGPRGSGALSRREQEVLALVAEGLSNAEVAERLFISTKTAGNHVSSILTKLGLRSRTEAAAYALLHPPPRSAGRSARAGSG